VCDGLASLEWKAYYRSHHRVRDDKAERYCYLLALQFYQCNRTTDPTTAFGMTKWRGSTICLPSKFGIATVLQIPPLRSG